MINGINGINGIWDLTPEQRRQYRDQQITAGKINRRQATAANLDRLYRNQNYIKKYGLEDFNSKSAQERDRKWKTDIAIEDAVNTYNPVGKIKTYSTMGGVKSSASGVWRKFNDPNYKSDPSNSQQSKPQWTYTPIKHKYTYLGEEEGIDPTKGTGDADTYNKILKLAEHDPDTYFELKNSGWKTTPELEKYLKQQAQQRKEEQRQLMEASKWAPGAAGNISGWKVVGDEVSTPYLEEREREKNKNIFNKIYNKYIDKSDQELTAEQETLANKILQQDSTKRHEAFLQEIKENNPTLYAYYDKNGNPTEEMGGFTDEDEARYLAKAAILRERLGEEDARLALNNYADRYLKSKQSWLTRQGMYLKQWAIKTGSYTSAKATTLVQRAAQLTELIGYDPPKVRVWMNTNGDMVSADKVKFDTEGNSYYTNYKGEKVPVRETKVSLSDALHNGIDEYGNKLPFLLNAKTWSDAERFNIAPWNERELEKANDLGTSTSLVKYNPGETQPWWTSTIQMSSFILSDALTTLLTGGVGEGMAVVNGLVSANAIGYQYEEGVYEENYQKNMAELESKTAQQAIATAEQRYSEVFAESYEKDNAFKSEVDEYVKRRTAELKSKEAKLVRTPDGGVVSKATRSDADYEAIARGEAMQSFKNDYTKAVLDKIKNSDEYLYDVTQASEIASNAASIAGVTDAVKYAIVNTIGFRKYLFSKATSRIAPELKSTVANVKEVIKGDQKRLALNSLLSTAKDKGVTTGKLFIKHAWGGGWTNYTDEMQAEGGRQINEDRFTAYLNGDYNGEGAMDLFSPIISYLRGAIKATAHPSTTEAGIAGAMSAFLPTPTAILQTLASKEGRSNFKKAWKNKDLLHLTNMTFTNGILNDYTSIVDAETQVQEGIDFVNNILDQTKDFDALKDALALELAKLDVKNETDANVLRFLEALRDMHMLNTVDVAPTAEQSVEEQLLSKSSVIQEAVATLDKIINEQFTEEDANEYLKEYYAKNPSVPKSEENNKKALQTIKENAQFLRKAFDTYEDVRNKIEEEQNRQGKEFSPEVQWALIKRLPLDDILTDQLNENEQVLAGKSYSPTPENTTSNPLTFGNREARQTHIKSIDNYRAELEKRLTKAQENEQKAKEAVEEYQEELKKNKPSDIKSAVEKMEQLDAEYANAKMNTEYLRSRIGKAEAEKAEIQKSLDSTEEERVLTKDEILHLGAVDRARMMDKTNRSKFSKAQQVEIEALEKELLMKDPSALSRLQEQSVLQRHLDANRSAYTSMLANPEAAAVELEAINHNYVQNTVNSISQKAGEALNSWVEAITSNPRVSNEVASSLIFQGLRQYDPAILRYLSRLQPGAAGIETLSNYKTEIEKALEWSELNRTIANTINQMELSAPERDLFVKSISNIISTTQSRQEAEEALQNAASAEGVNEADRGRLSELIKNIGLTVATEQATVTESKDEKKSRENDQQQQAETAKKQKEEIVKKAEQESPENVPTPTDEQQGEGESVDIDENTGEPIIKEGKPEEPVTQETSLEQPAEQATETPNIDKIEKVNSPDIEQQVDEANKDGDTVSHIREMQPDTTDNGNLLPEPASDNLLGNALYGYDIDALVEEGKEVGRMGRRSDDHMSRHFNWLKNAGIKLQEIIDYELKDIVKANSEIRFLYINPVENATDDAALARDTFLAVEYTDKVAKVHNKDRGGVVQANGKQYLIIGTLGYNPSTEGQATTFLNIVNQGRRARDVYFSSNTNERFFVDPNNHTEIQKISSGRLVRQTAEDAEVKVRRISDLLADPSRNPEGLALEDLKWLIQYRTKAATVGVNERNIIHTPTDGVGNAGNTFLLIESANGEYSPIYIIPTRLSEIADGSLKDEIMGLIDKLTSPDHWQRYDAVLGLSHWLYLDDNTNILIGTPDKPTVTVISNGVMQRTFDVNSSEFNTQDLLNAIMEINPRINLTTTNLRDKTSLKWLDEAGALTTDIAKLGTSNASYTVYAVDSSGNPIKTEVVETNQNLDEVTSDLNKANKKLNSQVFGGETYRKRGDTWVTRTDIPVTNKNTIEQLNMNNYIRANNLLPSMISGDGKFFIIDSNSSNPTVWKQGKGNVITVLNNAESAEIIDRVNQLQIEKAREEAAKRELENIKNALDGKSVEGLEMGEEQPVEISDEERLNDLTEEVTETVQEPLSQEEQKTQSEEVEEPSSQKSDSGATAANSDKSFAELQQREQPTDVGSIMRDRRFSSQVRKVLKEKGFNGSTIPDVIAFLESKHMPTTGINDFNTWLEILKKCR